jgi:hypothetical protein
MSSVEPLVLLSPLRSCCRRECGDRGSGEPRLGVPSGDARKRGKPKDDVVDFGLRLNDILWARMSLSNRDRLSHTALVDLALEDRL